MERGLSVETEISGRALADLYYMGLGGLGWSKVLKSAFPPQRLRPDSRPEHQDPVSHTTFGKSEVFCQRSVGVLSELFYMWIYF